MARGHVVPPPGGNAVGSVAPRTSEAGQPMADGISPAVRAQLLATEHWSLLSTRTMAQNEVLTRITTFLMLVSASIVSLALVEQVTRFDGRFITFALVLLGLLVIVGTLTQMRVRNQSIEDLAHVIGMNRLRAAYVELDPGLERFLVTSPHDDDAGMWQTYNHLMGTTARRQLLASSGAFIAFVNAALTGAFAGLAALALDAPGPVVGVVAAAAGLVFLVFSVVTGSRKFQRIMRPYVPLFPGSGADREEG
jgi:hypothetical protein